MFTAASIDHVLLSLAAATPPVTTTVVAGTGGAPSSAKALEYLVVTSLDWSGRVLGVIVILIVAWMTAAWARRSVYRIILKAHADITVASFAGNTTRWVILILGLIACLSIFGINIAAVTAVIGAAGLAVGLAMQGSLSNLAAGIMLLILRPFRVGDGIAVAGQSGRVNDIDLFSTKIDTVDNRRLIVPNAQIFGATIENASHHPKRRVDVAVRTPFTVAIDHTRETLCAAAVSVPQRLPSEVADAMLSDIAPNGLQWTVRVWVATPDVAHAKECLVRAVKESLEREGIPIAVTV